MVGVIQSARIAARKAIESTYEGVAQVTERVKQKDPDSGLTKTVPTVVLENQPCKLSFESIRTADQTESGASVAQTTKLFISPDIIIKPGSKITVTQSGHTSDYTHSGVPAVYDTHQEIILDVFKEWA